MPQPKLYTLQLVLSIPISTQQTKIEYCNIEEPSLFGAAPIWRNIYRDGAKYQVGPGTWEIISPFIIKQVFIIQQKERI